MSDQYLPKGANISFPYMLKQKKKDLGISWSDIDQMTGVNGVKAYANEINKGKPHRPPVEKLEKICSALGIDFTAAKGALEKNGLNLPSYRQKPIDYEEALRIIGDAILGTNSEKGESYRKLSSSSIRIILGEVFYSAYAKTYQQRAKMHQDLIAIDEGKYNAIKLQKQIQNRTGNRRLNVFPDGFSEENFIEDKILGYIDSPNTQKHRVFSGSFMESLSQQLNQELSKRGAPPRSDASLRYHINKLYNGSVQREYLSRKSADTQMTLQERIEQKMKRLDHEYSDFVTLVYRESEEKLFCILAVRDNPNCIDRFVSMEDHYQMALNSEEASATFQDADVRIHRYQLKTEKKKSFLEKMLQRVKNPPDPENFRADENQDIYFSKYPEDIKTGITARTLREDDYAEARFTFSPVNSGDVRAIQ